MSAKRVCSISFYGMVAVLIAFGFHFYGEYRFNCGVAQEQAENGGTLLDAKDGGAYRAVVVLTQTSVQPGDTSRYYQPPFNADNLKPDGEYVVYGKNVKPVAE